uniref:Uncharacterized protein n=1 Tax=Oryza brachyantha TaxID=4533 RepID=J3NB18_ORYBR
MRFDPQAPSLGFLHIHLPPIPSHSSRLPDRSSVEGGGHRCRSSRGATTRCCRQNSTRGPSRSTTSTPSSPPSPVARTLPLTKYSQRYTPQDQQGALILAV